MQGLDDWLRLLEKAAGPLRTAAALGHGLLTLQLYPDRTGHADAFTACALAFLALGKKPESKAAEFERYYASPGKGHYNLAGRYLLGKSDAPSMLAAVTDMKKRCELSYYLGLGARLKGDFPAATKWYGVATSPGMENVGEHQWAFSELQNWKSLGTTRREALPGQEKITLERERAKRFRRQLKEKVVLPPKGSQAGLETPDALS